ncbi:MAG TPA: fumarate hydratase [Dehalococcoidia bacterium]|nr:fumarate hydratase [Dehalococcoidia bacterium]
MREIEASLITETIARLCQEANYFLPEDMLRALKESRETEKSPLGKDVLGQLLENAGLAASERLPLCQDCGTVVVFMEIGQDVHIKGDLSRAVDEGVRLGYKEGYLRASIVQKPFSARLNTGDNTPAILHVELVPGDRVKIWLLPKGGGAENMSRLAMLEPGAGREGLIDFVLQAVEEAGSNPCPPVIVGVGIGGTSEKAMLLAKKALLRPVGQPSPDPEVAGLEEELLEKINALGIGPEGFGGTVTALAVHAETFPTHITQLPVAVNLQCHANRCKQAEL